MKYFGEDYVPVTLQRLHETYLDVKDNMIESRKKNRERINAKIHTQSYEIGDPVYYYDPTTKLHHSSKLTNHWKPYYRIVDQYSPVNFKIRHQLSGKSKNVHKDNIRLAHSNVEWDQERVNRTHILDKVLHPELDISIRRQPFRSAKGVPSKQQVFQHNSDSYSDDDNIPLAQLRSNEANHTNANIDFSNQLHSHTGTEVEYSDEEEFYI
ncbi:hypothetical protein LOTGIDRAFT_170696 [Lottia gigantea]|uniref:Integrase zinc-binding domain-containing protein n=1 Tax=Lottia gigantea TaxID=225164 RepID=V4BAF3_LOTGI|nr:hypothetical protein LOTGIDRAFT_170696 [Lottia gigantea]ESP04451.1 hypothetical protein LOTGIDRAFT_170696 [Lottia gigantea]